MIQEELREKEIQL